MRCRWCNSPMPDDAGDVCADCILESEDMHRQNDPHYLSDEDVFPDPEDDGLGEPVGCCDGCEQNVYEDDAHWTGGDLLCGQCAWLAGLNGWEEDDEEPEKGKVV